MPLNAVVANENLSSSEQATDNLSASCQGILDTNLAPSDCAWYFTLHTQLQQAQNLARQWQTQYATRLKDEVLMRVIYCGQAFTKEQSIINLLFDQAATNLSGAQNQLEQKLTVLGASIQLLSDAVSKYEQDLRAWGQELAQVHSQMGATIAQIQGQEATLQSQIESVNKSISSLQAQIITDRRAIAEAKAAEDKGRLETIFGIVFAPFTGGLSLILASIGVSSIVQAEGKVSAMERTIQDYQSRIVADQQNLNQDQAQLVTLNGLSISAGIALSDIDICEQMLDILRTDWDAFFQELNGVISKITKAQQSDELLLERVWFNAACTEWELIITGTQGLIGAAGSIQAIRTTIA